MSTVTKTETAIKTETDIATCGCGELPCFNLAISKLPYKVHADGYAYVLKSKARKLFPHFLCVWKGSSCYVKRADLAAEAAYGPKKNGYDVHHINFNKLDDESMNLAFLRHADHMQLHSDLQEIGRQACLRGEVVFDRNTGWNVYKITGDRVCVNAQHTKYGVKKTKSK